MTYQEQIEFERKWPEEGHRRIPSWIYTDEEIFRRELETFHYGDCWNFIGLECEVPEVYSYKRAWIGPRSVLMTRDENGEIHVVENRCAHRDSQISWHQCGKFDGGLMVCPYHNWSYDMKGNLKSMPFFRGPNGNPGMAPEFDRKQNGLVALRTVVRGGVVWATYSENTPSFEEYLGEYTLKWYDRLFNGKKLKLLGYNRQIVPCNWKFYSDNTHDGYHAALLHTFIPKFGLWRPDGDYHAIPTANGRHVVYHMQYAKDLAEKRNEVTDQLSVLKSDYDLEDKTLVTQYKDEFGDNTNGTFQVFPTTVCQQFFSSLTIRNMIPKSATSHELSWLFFGYEDDDEEMVRARMRHSNLVGPSGFISAEDTEVIAQLQPQVDEWDTRQVIEMGGTGTDAAHTMISESPLRAFYEFYRREMKL